MGLEGYFDAQRRNLSLALKFPPFAVLVPLVDSLYGIAIENVPKTSPRLFCQLLLVCHKSFLSAASLIGVGHPDDAAALTRRAIEATRVAAALHEDPKNVEQWLRFEERLARWEARQEDKKTKSLQIHLEVRHPLVGELMQTAGILSDGMVHFTPEYLSSLSWKKKPDLVFLNYFNSDPRVAAQHIQIFVGTHWRIHQVFNDCFNRAFMRVPEWVGQMAELQTKGNEFAAEIGRLKGEQEE